MEFEHDYFLKLEGLGKYPELKISKDEYTEIIKAREILNAALSIEEKYDIVLGNFLDFEKELLALTLDKIVGHSFDYDRAYAVLSAMNRRTVNFLVSGKSYTKSIAKKASKCVSNSEEVEAEVTKMTNSHYDNNIDYRLMEALRNHVSHSGGCVHLVENPDRWTVDDDKQAKNLVFNTSIYALKKHLSENAGFKGPILRELPDKIDLKKAVRSYLGAISRLQEGVRNIISESVRSARAVIEDHKKKYADFNNGCAFAVGAYSAASHKLGEEPIMLILEWDDVRMNLIKKNQSLSNMEKRYMSTAI